MGRRSQPPRIREGAELGKLKGKALKAGHLQIKMAVLGFEITKMQPKIRVCILVLSDAHKCGLASCPRKISRATSESAVPNSIVPSFA